MSDYDSQTKKALPADIRMFSGCKDEQTSADVSNVASFNIPANAGPTGAGGACTNALLSNVYNSDTEHSWIGLMRAMQTTLKTKGYTQIPQFSGSRALDMNDKFSLVHPASNGTLKSLFIGINYVGQQGELRGCHNDVLSMQKLLDKNGFSRDPSAQRVLMDDGAHSQPTRQNIVNGMRWLIADAKPGDTLFMHYSGHGGSIRDRDGDEKDGKDETMCPVDFRDAGQLPDDEIFKELCCPLPEGVQMTVLMDCCHSGSILDLPYSFTATEENVTAVESGAAPSVMAPNPGFNLQKLLEIGQAVFKAYQRGGAGAATRAVAQQAGGMAAGGVARAAGGGATGQMAAAGVQQVMRKGGGCCTIM